jgi:hypothetical protein
VTTSEIQQLVDFVFFGWIENINPDFQFSVDDKALVEGKMREFNARLDGNQRAHEDQF